MKNACVFLLALASLLGRLIGVCITLWITLCPILPTPLLLCLSTIPHRVVLAVRRQSLLTFHFVKVGFEVRVWLEALHPRLWVPPVLVQVGRLLGKVTIALACQVMTSVAPPVAMPTLIMRCKHRGKSWVPRHPRPIELPLVLRGDGWG